MYEYFRGAIVSKAEYVKPEHQGKHLIVFEVTDMMLEMKEFAVNNRAFLADLRVTVEPWLSHAEELEKYFWAMRDCVAKTMGDTSREHKEQLYLLALAEIQAKTESGHLKTSVSDLNTKEMWLAVRYMQHLGMKIGADFSTLRKPPDQEEQ